MENGETIDDDVARTEKLTISAPLARPDGEREHAATGLSNWKGAEWVVARFGKMAGYHSEGGRAW